MKTTDVADERFDVHTISGHPLFLRRLICMTISLI
jgi:hypothetical protein